LAAIRFLPWRRASAWRSSPRFRDEGYTSIRSWVMLSSRWRLPNRPGWPRDQRTWRALLRRRDGHKPPANSKKITEP